jgi:hypothetical protein
MADHKDFIWDMQNSAKIFPNNERLHGLSMLCIEISVTFNKLNRRCKVVFPRSAFPQINFSWK